MARKKSSKKRWPITLVAVVAAIGLIGGLAGTEDTASDPDGSPSVSTPAPTPEAKPDSTVEPSKSSTPAPTPSKETTPSHSVEPTPDPAPTPTPTSEPAGPDYVLNTSSKKFHYPSCSSAKQIKESNKKHFTGSRTEVISMGYDPCKKCNP